MKADNYLKELTKRIEDPDARKEIMREYQEHIEDCRAALMESGMSEEEAEEEARIMQEFKRKKKKSKQK